MDIKVLMMVFWTVLLAELGVGMELPLTAVMILWINLVTDGACTLPLGVEP